MKDLKGFITISKDNTSVEIFQAMFRLRKLQKRYPGDGEQLDKMQTIQCAINFELESELKLAANASTSAEKAADNKLQVQLKNLLAAKAHDKEAEKKFNAAEEAEKVAEAREEAEKVADEAAEASDDASHTFKKEQGQSLKIYLEDNFRIVSEGKMIYLYLQMLKVFKRQQELLEVPADSQNRYFEENFELIFHEMNNSKLLRKEEYDVVAKRELKNRKYLLDYCTKIEPEVCKALQREVDLLLEDKKQIKSETQRQQQKQKQEQKQKEREREQEIEVRVPNNPSVAKFKITLNICLLVKIC